MQSDQKDNKINPSRAQPLSEHFHSTTPYEQNVISEDQAPVLLIIDGHGLAYRAQYAQSRPLTLRETGEDIRVVYGFVSSLFKVITDLQPTHVILTFDPPGPTFRNEQFAQYKANRRKMEPEFHAQVEKTKVVLDAMQIPVYQELGYEADDLIGTIAEEASEKGTKVLIFTGDSDLLQLVTPKIEVFMSGEQKLYDIQGVMDRLGGLEPKQQIEIKALSGDASDNIPGVPGIGKVTALKLIQKFNSIENLYEHLDDVHPPRIQQLLRKNKSSAEQAKQLVTIFTKAPVEFNLSGALFGQFDRSRLLEVLQEFEFASLIGRIPAQPQAEMSQASALKPHNKIKSTKVNLISSIDSLESMVKDLETAQMAAFDVETTSLNPMNCTLVGISFACAEGEAYYIPVGHQEEGQLQTDLVINRIRQVLQNPSVSIIAHNANFDLTVLANYGIQPESVNLTFDTMLAAHLLGERTSLKQLASNILKIEMTQISELIGSGRNQITFDQVSILNAAPYAAADADMTIRLKNWFESKLHEQHLLESFNRHEMPLVPVLVRMQLHGITVDTHLLRALSQELGGYIKNLEDQIYDDVGHEFNIGSPKQLADVLYTELNLPKGKRTQTGFSTDAATLESLSRKPPELLENSKPQGLQVVKNVLEYREFAKLKSTYVETLPLAINPYTGRVHTRYNQAGTATGRIASNDPNLQNIPIRTELGRRVRKSFGVEEPSNWQLLSADYSQVELRVLAHLSQDPNLIRAFERDEDIHSSTASQVFGVPLDKVTSDMRRIAKVMNFGVIYGLTAFGISQQTELSPDQGSQFIKTYFGTYPRVWTYLEETIIEARESGYVQTYLGRKRYIPDITSSNYQLRQAAERMAVNMPVQGTAAEIIKEAMLSIHRQLNQLGMTAKMLLQVHDELVFEVSREETEPLQQILFDTMPNALNLDVPLKIDLKIGATWGDLK